MGLAQDSLLGRHAVRVKVAYLEGDGLRVVHWRTYWWNPGPIRVGTDRRKRVQARRHGLTEMNGSQYLAHELHFIRSPRVCSRRACSMRWTSAVSGGLCTEVGPSPRARVYRSSAPALSQGPPARAREQHSPHHT